MDLSEFGDPGLLRILELIREARKEIREANAKPLNTWDDKAEGTGSYTNGFDYDSDPVIDQPSANRRNHVKASNE